MHTVGRVEDRHLVTNAMRVRSDDCLVEGEMPELIDYFYLTL